jgi:hypothetical protein
MINLPQGDRSSYGASGSDAPLASSPDRGTLEHRDGLQRDWTLDDFVRAFAAGAISRLQFKVLVVDLMDDERDISRSDREKAADRNINSTANAVSTARCNGVKRMVDFLGAS